ncbi:glycosyl hydrolase family 18 protein [Ancylobacter mangrovi]|uniref:glycosyl hydrolase family 18 protein n=1 Tax=Ancylobacter mangrovi TaxID=2972472 RepID=UPI002163300F|nr:glycosyl hydrolase family 18 protein [Ancylobacter mangrovi]MCS0504463.1 glycosyl hydrolase family 18 protein [Ancylobacter mangrovi]
MVRHPHPAADRHPGPLRQLGLLTLALLCALPALASSAGAEPRRPFLAYQASWEAPPASSGAQTSLAGLPAYITHAALAFVKPDLVYPGGLDLSATGLQYSYSGAVLRDAIAALKRRNPGTKVLLAVGGATYGGWDRLDTDALARLVADLGADGVDIDYEPKQPSCVALSGRVHCADDLFSIRLVEQLRAALPRPLVISIAGWSVGAYGEGAFADAPPRSQWRGSMLALLRSPAAGTLDLVSIMSYDAGPSYRPEDAFRAYRALWKGPLALGVQVEPGTNGGPRFTLAYTWSILAAVADDPLAGAMLYALELEPPGPDNPDYRSLAAAICVTLDLADCSAPVP